MGGFHVVLSSRYFSGVPELSRIKHFKIVFIGFELLGLFGLLVLDCFLDSFLPLGVWG